MVNHRATVLLHLNKEAMVPLLRNREVMDNLRVMALRLHKEDTDNHRATVLLHLNKEAMVPQPHSKADTVLRLHKVGMANHKDMVHQLRPLMALRQHREVTALLHPNKADTDNHRAMALPHLSREVMVRLNKATDSHKDTVRLNKEATDSHRDSTRHAPTAIITLATQAVAIVADK
jgi:hypothetical protein